MKYGRQGFTLIEVMVVICLVCLIATLGMMQLSFLDDVIVHAEIDKLAAACMYLRQKAIATNTDQSLVCDIQNNEYLLDKVHEKLSKRIVFGFLPNVIGSPGSPSRTITKAVTFPASTIHFYSTGIISSGAVYVTDNNKKIMYALTNAVSQFSYLRLYRYRDKKWKLLGKE
jgi:prepilin-type N-terminal cleavage/methylation domain-containing protein